MILIYFFLILLLFAFGNFLILKSRKDKKYGRSFFNFGDNNVAVYAIFTIIAVYVIINVMMSDPKFENGDDQISYGTSTAQPWLVSSVYQDRVQHGSRNIDDDFGLISNHFDDNMEQCPSVKDYHFEDVYIFHHYTDLTNDSDVAKQDVGNLIMGLYYFYKGDWDNTKAFLSRVKNRNLKYLNCYSGRVDYYNHDRDTGYAELNREIELNGYKTGAYKYLAMFYDYENKVDKLTHITYDPASASYVPFFYKKRIYIGRNDLRDYFTELFPDLFKHTNLIGLFGSLFILLIWIMYLFRINIHRSGRWFTPLVVVIFSALSVAPVWLIYDYYKYKFGFDLNGSYLNDSLYCVFGIGVIEEFVKILPFLIVLRFTKVIKQPIDYIMYASLTALGFAFIENFYYFSDGNLSIMHSRALTSSISHMIDSSIIAYGLVIAKFKRKKSQVGYFFLFFLIAAFAHGIYDFWVLNPDGAELWPFTFLCLLTSILVYASFINNCLNNPVGEEANIQLNSAKLASDLAGYLIGIFIFEYICVSFVYGPHIGNRELITSSIGGGYMILFLSIRLSNLDVFPGEWSRIEWFVGLLPMQIMYGDKKPNFNSVMNSPVRIRTFRKKGKLDDVLPVEGQIIRREKIDSFNGWFLVKLNSQLPYTKLNKEHILIRAKNPTELIGREDEVIIYFMAIPDMAKLDQHIKHHSDFHFVDWAVAGKPKVVS
ncbi:MAG TPA: PrsW family glutamic-type intramembrane protease [Bacteroidia bacterium]|jgi:RsiW-degrading membrane proteinase PrsW (M82 family)|nr:PrsW family glutamic-type intramembrane protease [Bacteroidia bacterium]